MTEQNAIVVTGASSGIGRSTTKLLLERGYQVIGLARDFSGLSVNQSLFRPVEIDLSQLNSLPARLESITAGMEGISGVVCCAGGGRFGSLEEFSYAQIRSMIELNLTSQIYLVRALLPDMKRQGRGKIIFLGSEAALAGGKRGAVYSAAKFGLRGLAQSLRQECATSGIHVTIINPGMVRTEFFETLDFQPGEEDTNYILPEDIAAAVLNILETRNGTVIDEINMSPLKKVIRSRK
jgi:short-subunit dehydrogenase